MLSAFPGIFQGFRYAGKPSTKPSYWRLKGNTGDFSEAVIAVSWQDGLHDSPDAMRQHLDDESKPLCLGRQERQRPSRLHLCALAWLQVCGVE